MFDDAKQFNNSNHLFNMDYLHAKFVSATFWGRMHVCPARINHLFLNTFVKSASWVETIQILLFDGCKNNQISATNQMKLSEYQPSFKSACQLHASTCGEYCIGIYF